MGACVYMIGEVTRHMLPHLSGVPHLHVNRPLYVLACSDYSFSIFFSPAPPASRATFCRLPNRAWSCLIRFKPVKVGAQNHVGAISQTDLTRS